MITPGCTVSLRRGGGPSRAVITGLLPVSFSPAGVPLAPKRFASSLPALCHICLWILWLFQWGDGGYCEMQWQKPRNDCHLRAVWISLQVNGDLPNAVLPMIVQPK